MRVLLIEDEPTTAKSIELMLATEGFNVYTTDLGEEGLDLGKLYDYDIILLDLNLPDMHGYDVLKKLRTAKVGTPVLILSGMSEMDSKVRALGFGADDYVTKPFHRDELVARIHAIVRRSKGHSQSVIRTGKLAVNLDAKTVEVDGSRVHLTGKEYAMLELLSLRKGTTLTKEMFLNHLYGGMDEPELKIIDVFICKLRKKLSLACGGDNYIETVWGRGYVLRDPPAAEALQGPESRLIGHAARPLDPIAEIDMRQPGTGGANDVVEDDESAETLAGAVTDIEEAVDHAEAVGLLVGEAGADQLAGPAVDRGLAIFDDISADRGLLDHVGEVMLVHFRHSAAGVPLGEILAEQRILLLGGPGPASGHLDVGMAAKQFALGGARREFVGEDPDRDAGGANDAARPVCDRLAPAEPDPPQSLVQFVSMAAIQLSEDLPLDLARDVRAGRRIGHEKLGKAKWCAHPPGLQWLRSSLCDW